MSSGGSVAVLCNTLSAHIPVLAHANGKQSIFPSISFPSRGKTKKLPRTSFWKFLPKDKEFIQKGIYWARDVGFPGLAKKAEDVIMFRNLEDPSAAPEPFPLPWPKPRYPELSGIDLLAADIKSLNEYATYIRGLFKVWRIPLQGSYDPDQIAGYFNCRPHVLAFRILEVSAAFVSVIMKTKFDNAFKSKRYSVKRKTNEIESAEYVMGEILKETMLNLGPTFVKVGQSISTRPDLVGEGICKVLADLQDQLPPFPNSEAMQIIEEELGCSVNEAFSSLSEEPVAAASFGQVYRGRTIEGQDVAVKVQRPNALYYVARDIYILRLGLGILGKLAGRKSDIRLYVDELGHGLFGELDYTCEAARASEFQASLSNLPFVSVPTAFTHLTGKKVLTMEWITGDKPKELLFISKGLNPGGCIHSDEQRLEARNRLLSLVNRGVEAFLVQLLETGLLHADPHPGNLVFTSAGQIGFLDFGLVCRMEKKHKFAMLASIVHIANADWPSLVIDLVDMDIISPGTDLRQVQMELQVALGDATMKDGIPDIKFSKVLGKIWSVALNYQFKMPPYFTLVLRSVASLEGLALAVDPNFKTFRAAYPYVVRRLLIDNSTPMRKILHSLVFNERKEFQWSRLALFLKQGEQHSKKRAALRSGHEDHAITDSAKNTDGLNADLANTVIKRLSAKDGAVLRRLLVTAETSSLARTFVSTDATTFHRQLISIFTDVLYEWGTRILREQKDTSSHQTAATTGQTSRMGSTEPKSLQTYKDLWRNRRVKIVFYTALQRLTRTPFLMLRVCWTFSLILCRAAALASHQLLVEFCKFCVQPISGAKQRRLSYQSVA